MFDLIAFDADDTLWHNEKLYRMGRERFREILARYTLQGSLDEVVDTVEIGNLAHYGYGVMSFVLSLVEAAVRLTNNQITAADIREIIDLGKEMLSAEVHLFDGAKETIDSLAAIHPLMLLTKGDLRHQRWKIEQSGLSGSFAHIEIVSDKTPATYATILKKHGVAPERFLMIGNSMRSDILPVIELGGWTILIPNSLTWNYETVASPRGSNHRHHEVESLKRVPALIERLADQLSG